MQKFTKLCQNVNGIEAQPANFVGTLHPATLFPRRKLTMVLLLFSLGRKHLPRSLSRIGVHE